MKKTVAVLMASLMCMGGAAAVASPDVVKPVSAYAITQSQQQQRLCLQRSPASLGA